MRPRILRHFYACIRSTFSRMYLCEWRVEHWAQRESKWEPNCDTAYDCICSRNEVYRRVTFQRKTKNQMVFGCSYSEASQGIIIIKSNPIASEWQNGKATAEKLIKKTNHTHTLTHTFLFELKTYVHSYVVHVFCDRVCVCELFAYKHQEEKRRNMTKKEKEKNNNCFRFSLVFLIF